MLLFTTKRGGEAGDRDLRRRIALFDQGDWGRLLQDARDSACGPSGGRQSRHSEQDRLAQALALVGEGELSHAARSLESLELAPGTQDTLNELTDPRLRPREPVEPIPAEVAGFTPAQPLALDKQVFADVLRTSRKGLSASLSGSRYELWKLCLEDEVSFNTLYEVACRICMAQLPPTIVEVMRVSALTALLKPNRRVRGIASADSLRRLVTKAVAKQKQGDLREAVFPFNFGLSDRSGTDAAVHYIQYLTDRFPDQVVMSVDGIGAFDHISRARIFEQLMARPSLRDLVPFVRMWYSTQSRFVWVYEAGTTHHILQGDGGEQGDALMPALFSIALHPALLRMQARMPANVSIIAYLDDIYIICDPEDAEDCLRIAGECLRDICHIDINAGKLAAWSKRVAECPAGLEGNDANGEPIWKGDLSAERQGVKVLGAPVGSPEYVQRFCDNVVEEKAKLLDLLPKLPSLQSAWLLLYFCAVPRINHLLRTVPPQHVRVAARAHDANVLNCFQKIFHIPNRQQWETNLQGLSFGTWVKQARLPLRLGGCGLRDSTRTSRAAYWASWADCMPDLGRRFPELRASLVTELAALQSLDTVQHHAGTDCLVAAELAGKWCQEQGWSSRPLWVDIAVGLRPPDNNVVRESSNANLGEWQHGWQFHASASAELAAWQLLLEDLAPPGARRNAATPGKARLHSCMGPFASVWLTACPTTESLTITNMHLQCAMRRRLGLAVAFEGADVHGHECLTDNRWARLNIRHTFVVAAWRQVLVEAGASIPDRNVERMISRTNIPTDPADGRRLDLIAPGLNVSRGLPLFCDVTVVSPITAGGDARPGTSNQGGQLLVQAEQDNNDIYWDVLSTGLGDLLCLGFEVYGRWGKQSIDLVPKLARERTRGLHLRVRRGIALALQHRWCAILGLAVQRAVAHIILSNTAGVDLITTGLEPSPPLADLVAV